ncbi:GNAT superfamily N-acetyltransferase [Actinoplanes octamycinicus]|uniref:GNAT superfamily N-acetyltransferase n=1 Tax=Actinoplanes octamycinicus TaxID=135948 RepID=A0A7W7M979_9ACTN|nr:GNAT family N-acetyltransferase [Actinoplanes octamycinicus]MBB4741541.1 GNAT superfamily N-acetyltransferase [Actinoplanes octamycinicus]GIE57091.1 hypothetical protein Aoc01nite_24930 [Actinoplanes octamycinicus]
MESAFLTAVTQVSERHWHALDDDRVVGRGEVTHRPDGRRFLSIDAWHDSVFDQLAEAMLTRLPRPLYTVVDEADLDLLSSWEQLGFGPRRREWEYVMPTDPQLTGLDTNPPARTLPLTDPRSTEHNPAPPAALTIPPPDTHLLGHTPPPPATPTIPPSDAHLLGHTPSPPAAPTIPPPDAHLLGHNPTPPPVHSAPSTNPRLTGNNPTPPGNAGARLGGLTVLPAGQAEAGALRELDQVIRDQVEATLGWQNMPAEVLSPPPDPARYVVAAEAGRYVGLARVAPLPRQPRIGLIAVRADRRRRGIARALLAEVLGAAHRRGIATASADVHQANHPAIALFESVGARRAGSNLELVLR